MSAVPTWLVDAVIAVTQTMLGLKMAAEVELNLCMIIDKQTHFVITSL